MRMRGVGRRTVVGRGVAVSCALLLALTACTPMAQPGPLPTPHYSIDPLVPPSRLRVEGSGASICASGAAARDTVMGFGIENNDSSPVTLTGVSFSIASGGRFAGAWTIHPATDLITANGLMTGTFDYPPRVSGWARRKPLAGTKLMPGAQIYLLLRFVRAADDATTLFLDPAILYTKRGMAFTATTHNSGYEYEPMGRCAFTDD